MRAATFQPGAFGHSLTRPGGTTDHYSEHSGCKVQMPHIQAPIRPRVLHQNRLHPDLPPTQGLGLLRLLRDEAVLQLLR
jgi:hypothetical protein